MVGLRLDAIIWMVAVLSSQTVSVVCPGVVIWSNKSMVGIANVVTPMFADDISASGVLLHTPVMFLDLAAKGKSVFGPDMTMWLPIVPL